MISRLGVVSLLVFMQLARLNGFFQEELKDKILILEDGSAVVSSSSGLNLEIYKCVIPVGAPCVLWDRPETPSRALGDARVVQSWCRAFCNVDCLLASMLSMYNVAR